MVFFDRRKFFSLTIFHPNNNLNFLKSQISLKKNCFNVKLPLELRIVFFAKYLIKCFIKKYFYNTLYHFMTVMDIIEPVNYLSWKQCVVLEYGRLILGVKLS